MKLVAPQDGWGGVAFITGLFNGTDGEKKPIKYRSADSFTSMSTAVDEWRMVASVGHAFSGSIRHLWLHQSRSLHVYVDVFVSLLMRVFPNALKATAK